MTVYKWYRDTFHLPTVRMHFVRCFGKWIGATFRKSAEQSRCGLPLLRGKPRYLAVDEFAMHKGHRCATCVMDLEEGAVLWEDEGRCTECFLRFFEINDPVAAYRGWTAWFEGAKASGIPALERFARLKEKLLDGLVSHARHGISTGRLEGFNNKIKVWPRGLATVTGTKSTSSLS